MSVLDTLGFLMRHPLSSRARIRAIGRYFRWQLGSRLLGYPVLVPFVDDSYLLASPGMTGATGNIYAGLHEFQEMAFLLHFLRPEDWFIDVGANVGSYTVLAAGAVGARVIAVEPVPITFSHLRRNVNVNNLAERVRLLNRGLSEVEGVLEFYCGRDTTNGVVDVSRTTEPVIQVPVTTLDQIAPDDSSILAIKLDAEGYELPILKGGAKSIRESRVKAVIVEVNGSGSRYGHSDAEVVELLKQAGFERVEYDPDTRSLSRDSNTSTSNSIMIRDSQFVADRLKSARRYATSYGPV